MILHAGSTPSSPRWTIRALLEWTEGYFQRLGLDSPRLDAEILLAHALASTRLRLYTEYDKLVEPQERARFRELVERRAHREPVSTITGRREFYSLSFEVTSDVLTPRPETELLVDWALAALKARLDLVPHGPAPRVLDLGTGSGAVAVAIAVRCPACLVTATDRSPRALEVARRNAGAHNVLDRVDFREGDWLGALRDDPEPFDLIVCNPPYIAKAELEGLMPEVRRYEPLEALVDAASPEGDGLGNYRVLAASAAGHLRSDGAAAFEVGAVQAADVAAIFRSAGWVVGQVIRDYGGIDRVVVLRIAGS